MTTLTDHLAEIRARVDAATEGPWRASVVATYVDADGRRSGKGGVYPGGDQGSPPLFLTMGWLATDAEFIAASRTDLPALLAAVQAVLELHRAVPIYDECECESPSPEDGRHKYISEVGVTCNRLYVVCRECCIDDEYQKEDCANYHNHDPLGSNCSTVRAITAALEVQG